MTIPPLDPQDWEQYRALAHRMVDESLDYLRLSIKYLVFDLEATRRENEYLRKLVQAQGEQDHDD